MRKRLLVLAGVALAAAVIVPAVLDLHAYRPKLARNRLITWEHYRGVKLGMSQAEVEAILGGPPGDYRTDERISYWDYFEAGLSPHDVVARRESWYGNDGQITLGFDEEGRVLRRGFASPVRSPPSSLAQRVRDWLRHPRP
jgi:hypothetical protein